ncbi:M15 family metallopeptidase, partial [bacterium]|nr:M15 family metallopeptidase [bacterium]
GDPTVKAIGANNTPLMTVETPGIGVKVDYTLERSLNNANDLGISVYGETYVSWRFIEDYIINELFMPRISSDKLEVYFSSIIPIPRAADAEEDAPIEWDSVRIINSKWLRSLNPEICILPGQESTVSEDSAKVEALLGSEATEFITSTFTADNEMSEGYLRNIMVNIDLVRKASIDADNVSDFALEILTQVSEACGSPWSFKVVTNTELGIISVIDENHGGNISNYTTVKESNPTPYIFSGNGDTNITRDLKIQTKLPNEIQALAYYAMSGAGPETSTDINMFKLYGTAVRDRLKKSQVRYNTETKLAQDEAANTNIWNAYRKAVSSTRDDLMMDLQDNAGYREATDSAKNFVKQFICNSAENNKLYSPPIPIDISLTLNGVSGIYMGNSIMVNTVSQGGILPERYKDIVALQVTSVDQQIGSNTWSTSINTLMRPITKLPAPRVPEDEVVTTIVSEVTTQSPGDDLKEVTADNLSEFSKYLTFTDTPYINGAPMEQQTFYAMRGSDSNGIFETEGDGIEYIAQKMLESLLALAQAANDAGHTLSINDAYRSYAKQQYLYDGYKNGTPGFNPAARPGTSKHQSGDAIDIDVGKGDIYRWLVQHAWKYGYMRTVAGEEWHWVYAPNVDVYSRVPKGHPTWYGVEMEA